jgi:amidase
MDRRNFMVSSTAAAAAVLLSSSEASAAAKLDLSESTVASLRQQMASGRLTSQALVRHYQKRIATVDKSINSMIEMDPDALATAAILDREQKAGKPRGPLHGIPVVIKDNIDTADKMRTTAGSLALLNDPTPSRDAFIVERLRAAGAVILGKTNLSEWANFRDNDSISGWSGRGGQTRNPYVLDRNPCGSSSGTGAAISADLAAVGIGTETDGSIVCPSSICGIVGLKPTVGLVSRSGIIPISETQDTAGPMTRTVADAAIVLNAIAGPDPRDAASVDAKRERVDYTSYLMKDSLRGARIGIARDYWGRRGDVDKVMDAAIDAMKKEGAEIIDVKFPNLRKFGEAEFEVLQFAFKDGLEKYLAARGSKYRSLDDLIRFNSDNASRELKYFGQSILESSAKKGTLKDPKYLEALATCRRYSRAEGIDQAMNEHRLDAIVGPSNAPTWMIDTVNGDCGSGYVGSSSLAAVAGYPNITVPAGFIRELPIGISFFGRAWSEAKLISIAYAFEHLTKARRAPKFLATYSA